MKQKEFNEKLGVLVQEALKETPAVSVVGALNATAFHVLYNAEEILERQLCQ